MLFGLLLTFVLLGLALLICLNVDPWGQKGVCFIG